MDSLPGRRWESLGKTSHTTDIWISQRRLLSQLIIIVLLKDGASANTRHESHANISVLWAC